MKPSTIKRSNNIKSKRVSIVQTPVRVKSLLSSNINAFSRFESAAANQKITGLDPELIENHQRYKDENKSQIIDIIKDDEREHKNKKSIHWQFIERLLLNFDETLLDPLSAFILEPHEIINILHTALPLIECDATLIRIDGPVKIFGDLHGQLGDLMSLFKSFGYPDTNIGDISFYKYIFLGDFVDRGQKSLEIICLLLSLKIEYPDRIFLIRGNHECHAMNEMYGFYHEINDRLYPNIDTLKYLDNNVLNENVPKELDEELNQYFNRIKIKRESNLLDDIYNNNDLDIDLEYEQIEILDDDISCELNFDDIKKEKKRKFIKKYKSRKYFRDRADCINYLVESFELTFRWLPLGILVSNKILCIHGGIGEIETIEEIEQIERPCDVVCDIQQEMDEQQKKWFDLLWSDPAEKDVDTGFQPNKRGVSCVFGSDIVRRFCKTNNIDLIIRGHQVVKDGFEYFAGGHLITLFSATNYCNVMDNAGAILCIDDKLRVLPKLVEPRQINNNYHDQDDDDHDHDDDDDDDDDENDNLQWKKLKQFPPSPMRNNHNDDDDDDNNNSINQEEQMSDNQFFNTIQPQIISFNT